MGADLVVRFAGEGGQGQVTAAEGMAEAAARVGYHVQTFATYPSQIEGGPVWAQTRISTNTILTQGDQLDVLVALNRQLRNDGFWTTARPAPDLLAALAGTAQTGAHVSASHRFRERDVVDKWLELVACTAVVARVRGVDPPVSHGRTRFSS